MLYQVPQTNDKDESAMAALIVRLRGSAPKPEMYPAGAGTDATLAQLLADAVDEIGSALGQRATLPLLRWDGALDGKCRDLAAVRWLRLRGYKADAGGDKVIERIWQAAIDYLARLAPAGDADGKTENPRYEDSGGNVPQDRARFGRGARSDSWVDKQRRARYGCC